MSEDVAGTAASADRFEREERLDAGGLGEVWRGTDRETGNPVAIKCEPGVRDAASDGPGHAPDDGTGAATGDDPGSAASDGADAAANGREQVRAGFRQELRWFRELAGGPTPGSLVQFVDGEVRDGGGADGGAYVVTELLDGVRVDECFDDDRDAASAPRKPGVDACRAIAPHVVRAVDFLHRNGVVHLDVKPGNVVERERGPPALIDLNSAMPRDAGTDLLFHRDPYTPPELAPTDLRDGPVTAASDVYALGKLCCFLLAGEAPTFEAESLSGWAATDPRDHGADCPEHLAAVVWRATQPQPVDRYPDAGAFADALRSALGLPERAAELVDDASGRRLRVYPGDAIGRWTADERVPEVVLPDRDRLLSPSHATLEWEGDDWALVDHSLNGTWIERAASGGADARPDFALSEAGRERRTEADAPLPEPDPPTRLRLAEGDRIAPVSPDVGVALRFVPE